MVRNYEANIGVRRYPQTIRPNALRPPLIMQRDELPHTDADNVCNGARNKIVETLAKVETIEGDTLTTHALPAL